MLELRPDSAHVWLTPVDTTPESRVSELEKLLSPDELERANRFVFPRDRSLFVVARAHIRRVLSKYRPLSAESWRFRRTAFGRPFISNGGDTDGLFFSLSHTHGMIASLISSTEHAGIDVEKLDGPPDFDDIARQHFSEPEYADLMRLEPADRLRRFYELWTLKEAYGKALGAGLSAGLDLVSFSFAGHEISA